MSDRPTAAPAAHLILIVDGRRLAIDPRLVREVIHVRPTGDAADPPPDVEAMRRARGPIMPVINLRRALGCPTAATMRHAVIVVVEAEAGPVGLFLDDGDAIESFASGTPLDVGAVVHDALHARTAAAS